VLDGVVRNVVPFGAFVDVGVGDSGLVHRSTLGAGSAGAGGGGGGRGRPEPHDVFRAGQSVRVKVTGLDLARGRISLALAE
jgi:uncharacterized protein